MAHSRLSAVGSVLGAVHVSRRFIHLEAVFRFRAFAAMGGFDHLPDRLVWYLVDRLEGGQIPTQVVSTRRGAIPNLARSVFTKLDSQQLAEVATTNQTKTDTEMPFIGNTGRNILSAVGRWDAGQNDGTRTDHATSAKIRWMVVGKRRKRTMKTKKDDQVIRIHEWPRVKARDGLLK